MPVEVRWYKETKHIIYTRFAGVVSAEDVQASVDGFKELTAGHTKGIQSVIEVIDVETYPTRLRDLANVVNSMKDSPDQGMLIIVGARGMARFLGNLVTQLANLEHRMVDTLEEADAILTKLNHEDF